MKQQTLQMKAGIDQQRGQQELQNKQTLAGLKRQEEMDKVAANEQILRTQVAAKAMEAQHKATLSALQIGADKASKAIDLVFQTTKGQQQAQQGQMKMDQQDAQASRQMARDEQLHQQQMELQAQAAQAQQQQQNQGE
jgi:hypothetical protein